MTLTYDASNRVSLATDSSGRKALFTYGTAGAELGRLIKVSMWDGAATLPPATALVVSYGYGLVAGQNRMVSFTDVRGKVTTYTYDANGFLASQVDPLSHSEFVNVYDTLGRVVDQADALGNHSTFAYDDALSKTTFTDSTGAVQTFLWSGNVPRSSTNPAGGSTNSFSGALDLTSFTDSAGKVWNATYDAVGNMLTRTSPAPLNYVESWSYDSSNNPLTYTDGRGGVTSFLYDAAKRLQRQTAADGAITQYTYDAAGRVLTITDPRGGVTTNVYDVLGNLVSVTDTTGGKTTYTYDSTGRVLTMVEPRGNVAGAVAANFTTTYTYDAAGHVLTIKDALARITTNTYDDAGNLSTSKAPDLGVTTYGYNAANELLSTTAPDGGVSSNEYDARGLRKWTIDPTGGKATFFYDGAGRTTSMVEPRGNIAGANPVLFTTTFEYDTLGRRTKSTDPQGKITTSTYDAVGRLETATDPQGITTYTYDQNGNPTSTNRTGIGTTAATFDSVNRMLTGTDPRGKTTSYTYDLNGNRTAVITPLGNKTSFTYDASNRVKTMIDPRGNVAGAIAADYTTTHNYDVAGNELSIVNPLGQTVTKTYTRTATLESVKDARNNITTYGYDTNDRVKTVVAPGQGTTTYTYNTAGRLTQRSDGLLHLTKYEYDLAGRLKKQTDPLNRFWTYDYDVTGNRTKTVDGVANKALNPLLGSTTVTYDSLGRQSLIDYSDTTPDVSFTYDAQGRVASMTDGAGTETYVYDPGSRLTEISRTGSVVAKYLYANDANGNVTSRTLPDGTTVGYVYDDDNRLVSVTANGATGVSSSLFGGGVLGAGWRVVRDPNTGELVTPTNGLLTFTPLASEGGGTIRFVHDGVVAGFGQVEFTFVNAPGKTFYLEAFKGGVSGPNVKVTLDANSVGTLELPTAGFDFDLFVGPRYCSGVNFGDCVEAWDAYCENHIWV